MTFYPKYILIGLIYIFCLTALDGQLSEVDSLSNNLNQEIPDTTRINTLNALGREFMYDRPDTSIILGTQALQLAEKIQWKKGMAATLHNLGIFNYFLSDNPKALDFYSESLKIKEELGDKAGIAKTLNNIGLIYNDQADYPKALDYYFRTLKIDDELGDKSGMAATLGNIGNIYEKQNDYPKALDYCFKAQKISEELGDKKSISSVYTTIGIIYHDQGDFKKALEFYNKAADISKDLGDENSLGKNLGNIGIVYYEQDEFEKALVFAFKALDIGEKSGNKNSIIIELASIGDIYTQTGKFAEAEKYLKKSLEICEQIGSKGIAITIEEHLTALYDTTGRYQLALKHQGNAMKLKEDVFNEDKNKEITRKELNYEFEKKESATKAEQDKKDLIAKAELKHKEQQRNYFIIGFVMLAFFAIFVFRAYRQKQKDNVIISLQKVEVEKQKHIIEEKNKGILDSITYARRIQQAKLPKKEEIYAALPDSFVLFKPKDIVSGDFYFFHKNKQTSFIVAADCTGHGVPGALMSMIGSEQLNEAVLQSSDTSEILKLLNNGVKISLRQSDDVDSTRDGMDIAICSVNTKTRMVHYAGANRPLWFIRNGQSVLEEIDPTKKAIGGLTDNDQHFQSHELQFQAGDTFYIFSDGYADQFGGVKTKKLMTKKLKEILLEIQTLSMPEQEKYLDNFIEAWKSGAEQVDDILIIGVRL
jgi:serine phosphatase RsbU (regulator of sigma subunit)/Tfp pilus assembly protein PilF